MTASDLHLAAEKSDSDNDVARVLNTVCGDAGTLVIASSDLSHYHDYRTAQRLDAETVRLFEALAFEKLTGDQACGFMAVCGLLAAAREHGFHVTTVDVRNSGDTAGPHDQVVGYAACVISGP